MRMDVNDDDKRTKMSESYDDDDDEEGSQLGGGGGGHTGNDLKKNKQQEEVVNRLKEQLKKQDNSRGVQVLRIVVLLFLFVTATLVCLGLYFYATNREHEEFQVAFEVHSNKLVDRLGTAFERRLVAFSTMANYITTYAIQQKQLTGIGFPFVTIPHFEIPGSDFRVQANAPHHPLRSIGDR